MKKAYMVFLTCFIFLFPAGLLGQEKSKSETNKQVSVVYHKLDPANVDIILTEDFKGQNEKARHTWDRESHRRYLSNGRFKQDSIFYQIAEGDWVATRFVRTMEWNGKIVKGEMMQFKHFKDGKIAEIWEYGDSRQVTDSEEEE